MANEKIKTRFILEVIGKPKEHLKETLQGMINNISNEEKVEVAESDIKEPVQAKEQATFYSSFAEVEIETEDMNKILMLVFKYMPANIEVIEPEKINFTNNEWNDFFNILTKRLHAYDEVSKVLQSQNKKMTDRLEQLEPGKWKKQKDN